MQSENLIVLFDLNSFHWAQYHHAMKKKQDEARKNKEAFNVLSFEDIAECMNYAITTHIAKNSLNRAIFYTFDENQTKKIFPLDEFDEAYMKTLNFVEVRKKIMKGLIDELINKPFSYLPTSQLIKALSKSICTLNKLKLRSPKTIRTSSRILVLFNSRMENQIFAKLMNCVFVLEHREVILDVLVLSDISQDYLQQAAQKTKGIYLPSKYPTRGLIQYMLHALTINKANRDQFKMPHLTKTNFSGSCTCHGRRTDLAWVCSVCLAIYCRESKDRIKGMCTFCHEKYDISDFNQMLVISDN